jgi:hypothetical protein
MVFTFAILRAASGKVIQLHRLPVCSPLIGFLLPELVFRAQTRKYA